MLRTYSISISRTLLSCSTAAMHSVSKGDRHDRMCFVSPYIAPSISTALSEMLSSDTTWTPLVLFYQATVFSRLNNIHHHVT
ncbi:hypothetical protein KCU78_g39, partial [Aureobasidium melanogenum]